MVSTSHVTLKEIIAPATSPRYNNPGGFRTWFSQMFALLYWPFIRYKGVIGRSPGLRRTINHPKGPTTVSSRNLGIQVQGPQKDVYLPKTSSTCRLILLAAVDLVASQLLFSRCPPTAHRPFIRPPLFSRHSYFHGTKFSTVLFAISTLLCIVTSNIDYVRRIRACVQNK